MAQCSVQVQIDVPPGLADRLLALLQGYPQPVCDSLCSRLKDFLQLRPGAGELCFVLHLAEDELIDSARVIEARFHA